MPVVLSQEPGRRELLGVGRASVNGSFKRVVLIWRLIVCGSEIEGGTGVKLIWRSVGWWAASQSVLTKRCLLLAEDNLARPF